MGFFSQAGKKKKKDKTNHSGKLQAVDTEQSSSVENELEKTIFLAPKERYISKDESGYRTSPESGAALEDSNERIVHEDSIIINNSDYLLRISETRMEAVLTLYRRF